MEIVTFEHLSQICGRDLNPGLLADIHHCKKKGTVHGVKIEETLSLLEETCSFCLEAPTVTELIATLRLSEKI